MDEFLIWFGLVFIVVVLRGLIRHLEREIQNLKYSIGKVTEGHLALCERVVNMEAQNDK